MKQQIAVPLNGHISNVFRHTLLLGFIIGFTLPATATTMDEYMRLKKAERQSTKRGTSTSQQERERIKTAYNDYLGENGGVPVSFVGQPSLSTQFPVSELLPGEGGLLTFQFIDPRTGLPISGPAIGSVLYEVNLDPDVDIFLPTGSSFDAGSNFAVPFLVEGFEPDIRATPFDLQGNPVIVQGLGGFNVAVGSVVNIPATEIPECSTTVLLAIGVFYLFGRAWIGHIKMRTVCSQPTCLAFWPVRSRTENRVLAELQLRNRGQR